MSDQVEVPEIVKVARDLSAILEMLPMLDAEAEHKANANIDGKGLPGGLAMVLLAPVANLEAWSNRFDTDERLGRDTSYVEDEDGDWEPVLQTLCFWTEQWRAEHDAEYGQRPTIESEAKFIKASLNWAWENEHGWDGMATDIRRARVRMENVLYAGERPQRGVPCLYPECGGSRLVKRMERYRNEDGDKAWRWSDWHCPKCHRSWTEERYAAMVTAAHESTKFEDIDGVTWCSMDYAARVTKRSEATIRQWVHKGHLATVCIISGRRVRFVSLADAIDRSEKSGRRGAA